MNESNLCKLCGVAEATSKHHIIPKSCGGKETEDFCQDCHTQVHRLFTNKELEVLYPTVEKLLQTNEIQKWVKWRIKHPTITVSHKVSNRRKKYSKYA